MSPAMVDFRSPASTSSSKFQSNRHRSRSSVTDRILPFPSHPIFRSGGIPDPSPPMDRWNLGQGVSVSSSASIPPPPPPPPPSNDSTASEKLSVPRFRKQRKYSGASRARTATIPSDSGGDQGFNPFGFGSRTSHNGSCVGVEEIGTQSVREQLFGWKPFVPAAPSHPSSGTSFVFGAGLSGPGSSSSNVLSDSVKGTTFDHGCHNNSNSGPGSFVFGSGIEKGSILSSTSSKSSTGQSLASADPSKSEGSKTILSTGISTSTNVENVGTGIPMGGSVFSFGVDNVSFDAGGFAYGSGAKKGGKSCHDSYLEDDNNSFYKLNTKKPVNTKNGKLEPVFFVHKGEEKKITQSRKSSSFNSDDGFLAEQTERTRKIDLNSTSNLGCQKEEIGVFLSGSCTGTKANLDQISSMHSGDSSIFSFSKLPEELTKLRIETSTTGDNATNDPAVFQFGSGVTKNNFSSKSSSFGAPDSFSKLPEKMEKLNLHSSTTSTVTSSCSKNAQLSQTSSGPDESGFSNIPRKLKDQISQGSGNEEHEHVRHNAFVFGSSVKEKANTDKSSSLSFDEKKDAGVFMFGNDVNKSNYASKNSSFGAFEFSSNLPEKMEKLDLCSSAYPVHVDTSSVNFISENSSKNAQFSQTSTGNEDGSFKIPGELKNQNLQSSHNEEHGNDKHGVFVFDSDILEKANSDKSSSLSFDNTKDPGVFVFGSGINNSARANKSSSLDAFECSFSKLPKKMEKLNLHSSACGVHDDTTGAVFGSEYSSKNIQFSHTSSGLDEGGFSKFPGKFKDQNMQSHNSEERGNHGVFVFGSDSRERFNSGKSSSFSFDESSACKLHEQVRMMKLSSSDNEVGSQKSKLGSTCNQHDSRSAFLSSNFILQFGKEDYCSRGARLQAHNSCGFNTETTTTPTVPGFQTSESDFNITTTSETPRMEFRGQKQDTSMLTKENLFTEPHKNMTCGMKKEDYKGSRLKKKRGKSRQSTTMHSGKAKQCVHEDKGLVENLEQDSTGGYSPMDYSPYQETLVSNQYSREASIASDETINFDSRCTSNEAQRSGSVDGKEGELFSGSGYDQNEEVFSVAEHFSANEDHLENEALDCGLGLNFTPQCSRINRMVPGSRKENVASKDDTFQPGITKNSSESESFSYDSSKKQTAYDCSGFTFTSNLDDAAPSNFHFASASFVQGQSSSTRRIYQRKSRVKGGQDPHPNTRVSLASSPSNSFVFPSAHVLTDSKQERKCNDNDERAGNVNGAKATQEPASIAAASVKTEEACEKWRLRGNQAYAEGDLSKAEDYYSRGVDSFPLKKVSKICSRGLMLCYSNRAATRMSLGRFREALSDCKEAIAIDPSFLRARLRAGNIFLSLGEPADALQHFEKVLQLHKDAKSDQKIQLEAVDGLEKAQKLNDIIDQSSIFLTKRTPDDAAKALELILEALSFSPYSEILLEMKADALVKLRNFDEAIQICEQTLELAEKNAVVSDSGFQLKDDDERSYVRLWRWRIISKSYFYLGKLEEANELLKKHEKMKPVIDKYWSKYPESSASFPVTVCELLRLKAAGNEAFQAGKHLEAVELYTAALTLSTESRPFTAICFCNRAAAYQALGQITDAIADCSLAIALDSSYRKAISRRATLHEIIRDYEQAATDLRKLTSLLEMSSEDNNSSCGTLGRSSSNTSDLNQIRIRLCTVEEDARKGGTMDLYMILGIEKSCSAAEVRKAYRKAALRHHPDKAGQFLARSENSDDRIWKEVAEEVHTNADRLFKIIGEAYAILVDPSKRQQYDIELESRSVKKSCGTYGGGSSPRTPASSHGCQFERSADPRHWRGSTQRRWTESSWSNR